MKSCVREERDNMRKWSILLILLVLAGCNGAPQTAPSYEETKKMMTDALQTEDGKKVMRQMLSDPEFRELLVLEHDDVQKSIEGTLLSEDAKKFWKDTFKDPKFSETFAKSMKEQQQDIMTELMKDPAFQKELETFFGQADMQKQLETILQAQTMRKEIQEIVQETIDSPLLKAKWQEMVKSAGMTAEEEGGKSGGGGGGSEGGGEQKKAEGQ